MNYDIKFFLKLIKNKKNKKILFYHFFLYMEYVEMKKKLHIIIVLVFKINLCCRYLILFSIYFTENNIRVHLKST